MTITWRVQSVGYWPRGNGACGRLDTYQSGNGILGSSDAAASDLPTDEPPPDIAVRNP